MRTASHASSPGPSAVRPQRGSRETSSIGAKLIASPSAAASLADSRADSVHASLSNSDASASGIGNMVWWPWMMSRALRDDAQADQQRDAKAGFLHRQTLHLMHAPGTDQVQQIADRAGSDGVGRIPGNDRPGHRIAAGRHGQLAQFLLERHRIDQLLDPAHGPSFSFVLEQVPGSPRPVRIKCDLRIRCVAWNLLGEIMTLEPSRGKMTHA